MTFRSEIIAYLRRRSLRHTRPKAALIDMDGTLYDSMPRHAAAWERLARQQGWTLEPDEMYLQEGRTGTATIDLLEQRTSGRRLSDEEKRRLYSFKTKYFNELPPVDAMPGAAAMLRTLEAFGLKRVLVTGSGQSSLIDRLDTDFPGAFLADMRISSRDVVHGKPDPEPYLRAMELAGVAPWQAMVVENAPLGVEAGARSGAFTVGVTTGPVHRKALEDAGADIVFPSMTSFAEALPLLLDDFAHTRDD